MRQDEIITFQDSVYGAIIYATGLYKEVLKEAYFKYKTLIEYIGLTDDEYRSFLKAYNIKLNACAASDQKKLSQYGSHSAQYAANLRHTSMSQDEIRTEASRARKTVRVYQSNVHICIARAFIDFISQAARAANTTNTTGVYGALLRLLKFLTPTWE